MSRKILLVNKPIGLTPLQIIEQIKKQNTEYAKSIISYAGRLDPMAHGLLLLLVDEENKKREKYLHLKKTYIVDILFGFETDTYDILGKVTKVSKVPEVSQEYIENEFQKLLGKKEQLYPPFSSKVVGGKPLFWWAREEKLDEIEIPKREIEISSISFLGKEKITGEHLLRDIERRINIIQGDFRQKESIYNWQKNIVRDTIYPIIKIEVSCSSGTYMRSLAHEFGEILGFCAIAFAIYRTKVGAYSIENAITI